MQCKSVGVGDDELVDADVRGSRRPRPGFPGLDVPAVLIAAVLATVAPAASRPQAARLSVMTTATQSSTEAAAQSISDESVLRPGTSSGKSWPTPDRYASGDAAWANLARNKTPDRYYEISICRVQCVSGRSTVEPFYGQP